MKYGPDVLGAQRMNSDHNDIDVFLVLSEISGQLFDGLP